MVEIEKKKGLDRRTAAVEKGYIGPYVRVETLAVLGTVLSFPTRCATHCGLDCSS